MNFFPTGDYLPAINATPSFVNFTSFDCLAIDVVNAGPADILVRRHGGLPMIVLVGQARIIPGITNASAVSVATAGGAATVYAEALRG